MVKRCYVALGPGRDAQMMIDMIDESTARMNAGVRGARPFLHSSAEVQLVCECLGDMIDLVVSSGPATTVELKQQELLIGAAPAALLTVQQPPLALQGQEDAGEGLAEGVVVKDEVDVSDGAGDSMPQCCICGYKEMLWSF